MASYYEILGVPQTATSAEVRSAYARLARERHPDRFSDAEEKARAGEFFKDLTAAFNTLSNDKHRREYDEELARPKVPLPQEMGAKAYARGIEMYEAKKYHEAVELLRAAVQFLPDDARAQAALGKALARNPHWVREGMQAIEKAIQLAPMSAAYQSDLAELLLAQGLKLRARKAAEAALRLDGGDERAMRVLEEVGPSGPEPPPAGGGLRGLLRRKG
ncbi:MAG TPA: DnaJ domain-containing protein [Vicinamibacteria bacterium]|nr:DnaJ domain-containing protein [Vicinamibacteria bacterium]